MEDRNARGNFQRAGGGENQLRRMNAGGKEGEGLEGEKLEQNLMRCEQFHTTSENISMFIPGFVTIQFFLQSVTDQEGTDEDMCSAARLTTPRISTPLHKTHSWCP